MTEFFGCLSLVLGAGAVALLVASQVVGNRFFDRLISTYPELQDSLPDSSPIIIGQRGGPLKPSYMKYLKEHRYRALAEPDLRAMGRRSWILVASYVVLFVALIISLLLWAYFRDNGP
jgi:hypothetical protein